MPCICPPTSRDCSYDNEWIWLIHTGTNWDQGCRAVHTATEPRPFALKKSNHCSLESNCLLASHTGPKRGPGRPSNAELLKRFAMSHRQPEPDQAAGWPEPGPKPGAGRGRGRGRGHGRGRPPSAAGSKVRVSGHDTCCPTSGSALSAQKRGLHFRHGVYQASPLTIASSQKCIRECHASH